MGMRILHLAQRSDWSSATGPDTQGWYRWSTRGRTLDDVGFLHASTSTQLPGVVSRFYADVDLTRYVVLVIDVDRCESGGTPVRWDAVGDDFFPHLYGPLPTAAVVATLVLPTVDGRLDTDALYTGVAGLDVADRAPSV